MIWFSSTADVEDFDVVSPSAASVDSSLPRRSGDGWTSFLVAGKVVVEVWRAHQVPLVVVVWVAVCLVVLRKAFSVEALVVVVDLRTVAE